MSGQDGNRGYLIQSLIALLLSLDDEKWDKVTVEADEISEKVDIAWYIEDVVKVAQVKSSINQISKANAKNWAEELESQSKANEYTLILVGPCSGSLVKMKRHGNVDIPPPKSLDFDGLINQACHLLSKFLENHNIETLSYKQRESISHALITKLSILGSKGASFTRVEFIELLSEWTAFTKKLGTSTWERVDFSNQRSIESAIAGHRLGPKDVLHCPELSISKEISHELERSNTYWILGAPGSGKSITAWHVAKKFNEKGYAILRPDHNAKHEQLLQNLKFERPVFLVIDDAQQYSDNFINRLLESSSSSIKILLTITDFVDFQQTPAIIDPFTSIQEIKSYLLKKKEEILPIIQKFDNEISNSYMGLSLESRLHDCSNQKTPWEFFWVLKGGWKSAEKEFNSVRQYPNSNLLLTMIAAIQIASCDAGVSRETLIKKFKLRSISENDLKISIDRLNSIKLISILDDIFRTKHISYARKLIRHCYSYQHSKNWMESVTVSIDILLDSNTSLKGVYWLLSAIEMTDSTRGNNKEIWRPILSPLKKRCFDEWTDNEWAIGSYYYLIRIFDLTDQEFDKDREFISTAITSSSRKSFYFTKEIANHLIYLSGKNENKLSQEKVKNLFEKIEVKKLIKNSKKLTVDYYFSFGSLVNRITYYKPTWTSSFIEKLDWHQIKETTNNASSEYFYGVDNLVSTLTAIRKGLYFEDPYKYIIDVSPFISKCFAQDPINAFSNNHDIFWFSLGYIPKFLRRGVDPDSNQVLVSEYLIAQLSPNNLASKMQNLVSRDLENLARTLSFIDEINDSFIEETISLLDEENFNSSLKNDWINQTEELQHFISILYKDALKETVKKWIRWNKDIITGPLHPIFSIFSPETAIQFKEEGRGIILLDKNNNWGVTTFMLAQLAQANEREAEGLLFSQKEKIIDSLYKLTLDGAKNLVAFFRIIHTISEEFYLELISSLDLSDERASSTIIRLNTNQKAQRKDYIKLAKLAIRSNDNLSTFGKNLLDSLNQT